MEVYKYEVEALEDFFYYPHWKTFFSRRISDQPHDSKSNRDRFTSSEKNYV